MEVFFFLSFKRAECSTHANTRSDDENEFTRYVFLNVLPAQAGPTTIKYVYRLTRTQSDSEIGGVLKNEAEAHCHGRRFSYLREDHTETK